MDDADGIARFIWIALVLLMVLSSLAGRRIPMARLVTWSLGWVVLFGGAYLLFTWFAPQLTAWQQARRGGEVASVQSPASNSSSSGSGAATASGASVSIPMNEDGHFWVDAIANGQEIRFLVDSGATVTALSQATANRLGLTIDPMRKVVMQTANGPVTAERSSIGVIEVKGTLRASDLPVVVSSAFGDVNVLGMNFLNKLKSWRVKGGVMILEAK